MSKKSKKRKCTSPSSCEEDGKASKEQDVTNRCETAKRKQESCTTNQECRASFTVKEDFQSTRQIKKAVYRLPKTQATDQKPVNKGGECSKTKSVSTPLHGDNCSGKAKPHISWKNTVVSGSKTEQRRPSESLKVDKAGRVPQREERTSTGNSNEKSSHRSPSRLKKQLMSCSLVSAQQNDQRQNVLKKKCKVEERPRTGNDSNTIKTSKSKTSSVCLDSQREKRKEMVKKMCQRHQGNDLKGEMSFCTEAKIPSATTREKSSTSAKHSHSSCTQQQIRFLASHQPLSFKIQKKVQPQSFGSTVESSHVISTNRNVRHGTKLSKSAASVNNSKQETVKKTHSCLDVTPIFPCEGQDKRPSWSGQVPATCNTDTVSWHDQMQVVEKLHLARSEKRLKVDVMQSYGQLTCMDIDPPEEGATDPLCQQPLQLILVLDTNILLSHLDYVKKMRSRGLGALGFPVVLIPWVVLQELDSLKQSRGLPGSVAHLACPAISYIYNSLKSRERYLWGQSMQQAAESNNDLNAENNDDRVLQCCLQYQSLYPECALILCTNDKNLCSKALLSGVKAHSKSDLEAEVGTSRYGPHLQQNNQIPMLPYISPQDFTPLQLHSQERTDLSLGPIQKDRKWLSEDGEKRTLDFSRCVSELEDCLREVLSDVLEVEMKAAYDDLWQEIVYLKPPWTLQDVLQCLKKHWIAVFGFIVPRKKLETVLNLISFFNSGKSMDCDAMLAALQEAKELVKAFEKSSSRVASALSVMDNIFHNLQPQGESPACDVVMNDDDDDEDKQPTSTQVSHQDVWALFENIWSNLYQISFEVFKALGFDPHTMQSAQPAGGPPPPQDTMACLQKLSSVVSQLLQAFSSVLSSAPGLEEVQALLIIIQSNKIADVDSRFAAKDLINCFSQQDYREKLRVGGTNLMELKKALDHCVETTGQHVTFNT
ncbi:hypothetical protein PAMA_001293 [Pampus argenteus]